MADTDTKPRPIRFEDFEMDTRAGELRKAGIKLKLTGQPLQVLAALLERPGDVVTRDELQKRLWPDTFVDVDHNLNTAINKIREALGDSAETPRYVETVPRRGYRFIGALKAPNPAVVPVEAVPALARLPKWVKMWAGIATALVVSASAVAVWQWLRHPTAGKESERTNVTPVPFTALPGVETSPAISPDGSRIVFAWNGDPASGAKGFDLYVKAIGSETMLRLTQHPSEGLGPTWSPDGTQIAFRRMAGADSGLYVVPALGGPERKLRSMMTPTADFLPISWSPDGKWIGFSDFEQVGKATITMMSTETWESKRVPSPPACFMAYSPLFSHDSASLAYLCFLDGGRVALYSVSLQGGPSKLISTFPEYVSGMAWSREDRALIYSKPPDEFHQVSVSDGSVKRFDFATEADWPTISPKGDMLAYSAPSNRVNLWRRDLLHPESPATNLIPSTRWEGNAEYSPDGMHIAFSSKRSGVQGVWVSRDDGSDLVEISKALVPSGSPRWSPDGKRIAFDAYEKDHWEIFVADVSERIPRKVVTNILATIRPSWSHDGKWIYFVSKESGKAGPYRCPASGGDAIALSKGIDAEKVLETFDGRTAYFASYGGDSVLREVSLDTLPGEATDVANITHLTFQSEWTLTKRGIYFVPMDAPRSLRYFDFTTKQIRTLFELDKNFDEGLSVSSAGRWILYAQVDEVNSDIMLVNHFH